MRVLVLENEPSSTRGGQELSLLAVCRGLAARGHEIELCYTSEGDLLDQYRAFCVRIDRVATYTVDRSRTLLNLMRLVAAAVQRGRRRPPDIVYANQYLDSPFARLLSWRLRRPFVCHLRLPPPNRFCAQYRWGMRGAVRLIATSQATRANYIACGFPESTIDVVYNAIDPSTFRLRRPASEVRAGLGIGQEAFVVLYVGRLHADKGIDVLVDAFAMTAEPAHLVIAGRELHTGSNRCYEAELRDRIRMRGVEARAHFIGHTSQVGDLYGAADVTVLPSIVAETFGRVIIESMACGTPVIASNVGGIPEILSGDFTDWLFPPGDAAALADRLAAIRSRSGRTIELVNRCRAHVERNFTIPNMIAGVEGALERALYAWSGPEPTAKSGTVAHPWAPAVPPNLLDPPGLSGPPDR